MKYELAYALLSHLIYTFAPKQSKIYFAMIKKFTQLSIFVSLLLSIQFLYAQNGNSTFEIFSEDGDPFVLVMNGVQQNTQAQTNVKIQNLAMAAYKIRVIYQNKELGAVNDKINLEYGYHQSYVIKKKKITSFQKNIKTIGNNMAQNFDIKDSAEANAKRAQIENEDSKYVIKMLSAVPLNVPSPVQSQSHPQQRPNNTQATTTTVAPAKQTTVVQQTTTTTGNNSNMNVNSNMDGTNVNMNINLGGTGVNSSYTETSTTTVHSTGGAQVQQVYVMPGYSGPTGCPWPMSDGDFNNAKKSISTKTFEDSKLTLAKQIFDHNCLLSAQVRDIMSQFTFEATKLEFAQYAYGRTFDIGNYYKVNDVFEFESTIDELNNYINGYKR